LAKIPGGEPGVKGISLFIVPKYRVRDDGAVGDRNNIALAGLNHKMGYRGTTNAVLNFGESGDCFGWLVGEENRGLFYMFHMMNEARVGVGMGATALGYTGYLHSLQYAQERRQGRSPQDKDPLSPQISIIEHADIKRLLLAQKCAVEGSLALVLYCAYLIDLQRTADYAGERERLRLLLDILTPVAKSWPSEFCLEANKHAIQILGGYGYTREFPLERFYRDNRLNSIHEGTHGIQGLDLLGRKVGMQSGAALEALYEEYKKGEIAAARFSSLNEFRETFIETSSLLKETTTTLVTLSREGKGNQVLANASPYLDVFGHVVLGWIWLREATIATQALTEAKGSDLEFYRGKVRACQYFYRHSMPSVMERCSMLAAMDDTCLTTEASWF